MLEHPPVPITTVLDIGIDAILGGSAGWLHIPPGGYLNVQWLSKKRHYRLTIDVTPGHKLDDEAPAFIAETRQKIEAFPAHIRAAISQEAGE